MVKEIYSLGSYIFYSAEALAEFKLNFPDDWEKVQNKPLKKTGIILESYQDFLDYLNSLNHCPDICIDYSSDVDRWEGYVDRWEGYPTTVWCDNIEVRGIFVYQESLSLEEHWVFEIISQSKWSGMKIIQKFL